MHWRSWLVLLVIWSLFFFTNAQEDLEELHEEVIFDDEAMVKSPQQTSMIDVLLKASDSGFILEGTGILLVIAFAYVFFTGKAKNQSIAQNWLLSCQGVLSEQFAQVGAYEPQIKTTFLKESLSCFKLYVTGRRFCNGALFTLDLVKRQDLISNLLNLVGLYNDVDMLTVDIPMVRAGSDPVIFALFNKKVAKKLCKELKDVDSYTNVMKSSRFDSTYVVYSESSELESELINEKIAKVLESCSDILQFLHISDHCSTVRALGEHMIRFQFKLPKSHNMERFGSIIQMICFMIDVVGSLRLPPTLLKKLEKKRQIVQEDLYRKSHETRQETAKRLKEEKAKREAELDAELSPAALRKKEEREAKKAMKRKGLKMKVLR